MSRAEDRTDAPELPDAIGSASCATGSAGALSSRALDRTHTADAPRPANSAWTVVVEPHVIVSSTLPRIRTHIEGFDLIRVLSAFNVVTFHVLALSNTLVGRGSVAAFVMIAGSLQAMRPDLGPFGTFARRRAARILVPWLFWSLVYGAIAGARYLRSGVAPPWNANWLLVGTANHLWFFVYILVAGLGVWWLLRILKPVRPIRASIGLVLSAALLVVLCPRMDAAWHPPTPFGLWLLCCPALLIGVALGLSCREDDERRRTRGVVMAGAATMAAAITAGLTGSTPTLVSYSIPAVLIPGALLLPLRVGPVVRAFAGVSMGIYAAHPIVLLALRYFGGDALPIFVSAPIVFLGAAGIAGLIRRMPGGTWIA